MKLVRVQHADTYPLTVERRSPRTVLRVRSRQLPAGVILPTARQRRAGLDP